jgi:ElaB/YqjD/DUF883 family membrane-anchored ribosome-binding protein
MADINELAQQDPERIQQQIEETRSSISEKLEALEEQVRGTVQSAKETVEETILSAKETVEETIQSAKETVSETISTVSNSVQETVETVKETFDLKLQVRRHPWPMVGGALAVGFVVGSILPTTRGRSTGTRSSTASLTEGTPWSERAELPDRSREYAPARQGPGLFDQFGEELQQVKSLAIGYAVAALRDFLKNSFPNLSPHLDDMSRSITTKLGGEPVQEPVFSAQGE